MFISGSGSTTSRISIESPCAQQNRFHRPSRLFNIETNPPRRLKKILLLPVLWSKLALTTVSALTVSKASVITKTDAVFFNSLPMSIYKLNYPSSSFFRASLRDNVANVRGHAMILRSSPSSSSSAPNSNKSSLCDVSDIPIAKQLASRIINIPLTKYSVSSNNSTNTEEDKTKTAIRASLAIAGGGSTALSELASTPGASSTLIDASILYDRKSFLSFIFAHPLPSFPTPSLFESSVKNDIDTFSDNGADVGGDNGPQRAKFSFVSDESASLLSNSALHQSLLSSHSLSQMSQGVGVGCTSTLVSVPREGREERSSRAHLCLSFPDGLNRSYSLVMGTRSGSTSTMEEGCNKREDEDDGKVTKRRTRAEEEEILGNLILWTLLQEQERRHPVTASGVDEALGSNSINNDGGVFDLGIINSDLGDVLTMQEWSCSTSHYFDKGPSNNLDDIDQGMEPILLQKIQDIINGNGVEDSNADPVVLIPAINGCTRNEDSGTNGNTKTQMVPLIHTVLPPNPIIFPGSFNPLHIGHVALARAAVKAMTDKYRSELDEWFEEYENQDDDDSNGDGKDLLETIWNTMEHQQMRNQQQQQLSDDGTFSILFEISLTNADKPPMKASEASRRVGLFAEYHDLTKKDNIHKDTKGNICGLTNDNIDSAVMPSDWGVLLTDAPLFLDKVHLLKKYIAQESPALLSRSESSRFSMPTDKNKKLRKGKGRILTFAIGTDTMVRLLNPKYYNQDREQMLEALRKMGREGVHFVVGGRVEQVNSEGEDGNMQSQTRFVTGENELIDLPLDVREIFTIVQEKDFRLDISSTELRGRS